MRLTVGDFSSEVATAQRRLGMPADGYFTEGMAGRVRAFQLEHGLIGTGVVEEATWLALQATVRAGLIPAWYGTPEALTEAHRRLPGDARLDLETALRRYQAARGLPLTGVLDEATAVALGD